MIAFNDFRTIGEGLTSLMGKDVRVNLVRARKKPLMKLGQVVAVYPHLFIIEFPSNPAHKRRMTFSHVDLYTKIVEIGTVGM